MQVRASERIQEIIGKSSEKDADALAEDACGGTMTHHCHYHRAEKDGVGDVESSSRIQNSWLTEKL